MPSNHPSITFEQFQQYVAEALETLPDEIKRMMENVAVTVAMYPTEEQRRSVGLGPGRSLYGLYQGVPLTQRTSYYGMVPPDRITIFMHPMVDHHPTPEGVRRQVQKTVLHEIGHHFGMSERQLRDLGY
ncbi:MAG TPA: metallopeptidase family protein [Anaerolineae bacterium]|nr:metallopeptidase family protein [Anaerolineae bacterium]HIQ12158.1 metallopeptidase family protein [Caldilineales bacterium]